MARKAKKEKTDVKGIHHRKMRLRGGTWDGVIIRQYARRVNGRWDFDDKLVMNSTHCYVYEQPPTAKKPGSMRLAK